MSPINPLNSPPRVLLSEVKIKQRIQEMASQIVHDYKGKELVVVCILKGSFIFFADLIRAMDIPMNYEFMGVSSYGASTTSSGEVKVTLDLTEPVAGKHILLVEDIVDSGLTMRYLLNNLSARKPASLKVASLLRKPDSLKAPLGIGYIGFEIAA